MRLYDQTGRLRSFLPDDVHPAREQGRMAGRNHAGDEKLMEQVVDGSLGCAMDTKQQEADRRRAGEYLWGFAEGWAEIMAVTPIEFLTRQETARVQSLPDWLRAQWVERYSRAVASWYAAGGRLSGRKPVLPAIPERAP